MGSNSLMAIGSAAVIGVYAAGYFKTKAAADRFAADADVRRPPPPSERAANVERTVERVTPPSTDPRGTRLRAGATAAMPPLPTLERAQDNAAVANAAPSPASAEPPVIHATVANAVPTAASTDSVASAAPVASTPVVSAPVPAAPVVASPVAPAAPPAPAPAPSVTAQPAAAKHAEPDPAEAPKAARWKDGTYYGWGTSRHGDIQAAVVIQGGRITNALIAQCLTRYSCSWIAALPPQVVGRQSAEVDYVSGATQSVNAFYYAILEALSHAK